MNDPTDYTFYKRQLHLWNVHDKVSGGYEVTTTIWNETAQSLLVNQIYWEVIFAVIIETENLDNKIIEFY